MAFPISKYGMLGSGAIEKLTSINNISQACIRVGIFQLWQNGRARGVALPNFNRRINIELTLRL